MTTNNPSSPFTLHGVFIDVFGKGVMLMGKSGIGKSEIALSLINRKHILIADDVVTFTKNSSNRVVGSCPLLLQDFLEVRGLGILNIRAMFGDAAVATSRTLDLIVNLLLMSEDELRHIDRIHGMHKIQNILNVPIPEVSIPVAPGRNLSILIEGAVRNQSLKETGYDAGNDFSIRQTHIMSRENT